MNKTLTRIILALVVCVSLGTGYYIGTLDARSSAANTGMLHYAGEDYALVQFNGTDAEVEFLDTARQYAFELKGDIAEGDQP